MDIAFSYTGSIWQVALSFQFSINLSEQHVPETLSLMYTHPITEPTLSHFLYHTIRSGLEPLEDNSVQLEFHDSAFFFIIIFFFMVSFHYGSGASFQLI
jgi:hypothetical protein